MDSFLIALQLIIALGIFNVWVVRPAKTTAWRGGNSTNLREEFAAYGLPPWTVNVIGTAKLLCATALVAGVWIPALVQPAAALLGLLMVGAIAMHMKIMDPLQRSLPALGMLAGCFIVLTV